MLYYYHYYSKLMHVETPRVRIPYLRFSFEQAQLFVTRLGTPADSLKDKNKADIISKIFVYLFKERTRSHTTARR